MIVTKPEVKKGFTLCKEKGSVTRMTWSKLLARVFKIDVSRCCNCQRRLNPDQWERVDKQPHIALMLVALNIEPHPPEITPAGNTGKLITFGGEYLYVDCED
jgi:hypothetical protein